jgi:hypothetical protein
VGITGDISRQYRRQSPLYPPAGHNPPHLDPKRQLSDHTGWIPASHLKPEHSGIAVSALGF